MIQQQIPEAELIRIATELAGGFQASPDCEAASVAAALVTRSGNVYTGICVNTKCSLGFCAEHAAIAEMLKFRESEVAIIVAVDEDHGILAPCGRCRELLWQVSHRNADTRIILSTELSVPLAELLPQPYRVRETEAPE